MMQPKAVSNLRCGDLTHSSSIPTLEILICQMPSLYGVRNTFQKKKPKSVFQINLKQLRLCQEHRNAMGASIFFLRTTTWPEMTSWSSLMYGINGSGRKSVFTASLEINSSILPAVKKTWNKSYTISQIWKLLKLKSHAGSLPLSLMTNLCIKVITQ